MPRIKGEPSDWRGYFPNTASQILADPDVLQLEVVNPSGVSTTLQYSGTSVELQRVATGIYDAVFPLDIAGEWDYRWTATGGGVEGSTDGIEIVREPYTIRSSVATNAYSSLELVQAQAPARRLTASSVPNTMEVGGFLTQTAAEINGILRRRGYVTPVPTTSAEARELMVYGNTLGAAALVEQSAVSSGTNKPSAAVMLWENWKKALAAGDLMPDAPKDTTTSAVRHSAVASPFFTRHDCN